MSTEHLDKNAIAEAAKTMTCAQIANNCGVPHSTMHGYLKRNGITPIIIKKNRYTELPAMAQYMTKRELAAHYKVAFTTIETALDRLGISAKREANYIERSLYSDLEELCKTMTVNELMAHYKRSEGAIRKALGARKLVAVYQRLPSHMKPSEPRKKRSNLIKAFSNWNNQTPSVFQQKIKSESDMAADFLRRECPIFRCTEDGKPNFAGKFFRYGTRLKTEDELVAIARRKGWQEFGSMAA